MVSGSVTHEKIRNRAVICQRENIIMIQPAAMQARCMLLIAADARLYGKHAWFRDAQTQLKNVAVLTSTVTVMIASAVSSYLAAQQQ